MSITIAFLLLNTLVGVPEVPKTAVFKFQTIGVDTITAQVATMVFRSELRQTGKFDVAGPEEIKEALGADRAVSEIKEARNAASKIEATKAVIGSLSRLGDQIVAIVSLIDVLDDRVEFEDRLSTTSKEELDAILKRLAKGLALKKKSEATAELGMVTEKETLEIRRREGWWGSGVHVGGFFPFGQSIGGSGMLAGFDAFALFETPDFFAEMNWRYYWDLSIEEGKAAYFMPVSISLFKVFSKTDMAPYAGGGLGYSWVEAFDESQFKVTITSGLMLNLGGGVIFFRTYDFRVIVDGRYYVSLAKAAGSNLQHGPSISIGIAYRRSKKDRGCCCIGF